MTDRTPHEPITTRILNVVPPYDHPASPDQQRGESVEDWSERYQQWKRAALGEQLPADVTDTEKRLAEWLVGSDTDVIATVASWLYRAREEGRADGVSATLRAEGEALKTKAADVGSTTVSAKQALSRAATGMIRRADRQSPCQERNDP